MSELMDRAMSELKQERSIKGSEIARLALAASVAIDKELAVMREECAIAVSGIDMDKVLMSLVAARAHRITTRTYAAGERGG